MMKNRESAARSRLRRQQHTENLEEHNTALKSEVLTLRAQVRELSLSRSLRDKVSAAMPTNQLLKRVLLAKDRQQSCLPGKKPAA